MKESLKRNWWKLLRGNENVNKLRSFVYFEVPLNYNFELRTFPISAAQIVANGGKWVESRKDGRVLQSSGIPRIGGRVASCYFWATGKRGKST